MKSLSKSDIDDLPVKSEATSHNISKMLLWLTRWDEFNEANFWWCVMVCTKITDLLSSHQVMRGSKLKQTVVLPNKGTGLARNRISILTWQPEIPFINSLFLTLMTLQYFGFISKLSSPFSGVDNYQLLAIGIGHILILGNAYHTLQIMTMT